MDTIPPSDSYQTGQWLHRYRGHDTVIIPLHDYDRQIRAYEVHGKGGPWLLTVAEHAIYTRLCAETAAAPLSIP